MVRNNPQAEIVRLSPSNWLAIIGFFGAQTVVLLASGIGMYARLAVLEARVQDQSQSIQELRADVKTLRVSQRGGET